ncbi:hypothetical protein [Halomonas caseinilytica]|uniref:hypothetical protein n=1 Tax=Halomonas caseinilytica TaxID=438744 RepID=UPI0008487F05|nr:hypothetical protein [Halomonas caseinilytica]
MRPIFLLPTVIALSILPGCAYQPARIGSVPAIIIDDGRYERGYDRDDDEDRWERRREWEEERWERERERREEARERAQERRERLRERWEDRHDEWEDRHDDWEDRWDD